MIGLAFVIDVEVHAVVIEQIHEAAHLVGALAGAGAGEAPGIVNAIAIGIVEGKRAHAIQQLFDVGGHS